MAQGLCLGPRVEAFAAQGMSSTVVAVCRTCIRVVRQEHHW